MAAGLYAFHLCPPVVVAGTLILVSSPWVCTSHTTRTAQSPACPHGHYPFLHDPLMSPAPTHPAPPSPPHSGRLSHSLGHMPPAAATARCTHGPTHPPASRPTNGSMLLIGSSQGAVSTKTGRQLDRWGGAGL